MMDFPIETCPVDGCDRGPFDDEASLRGHVNASGADGHDWAEVKQLVAGDGAADSEEDDQPATSEEAGKAGDGSTTNNQPTEGDDQQEAGEKQGDEQATEGDEGEMPTESEYQEQHDTSGEQGKAGDGDSDGGTSDQDDTTSGSPLAALPMDPLTLGMLLAVALGIWLAYRAVSGPSDSEQATTSDEQAKAGDGDSAGDTSDGDPSGGLVA
ncbi:hypothetical protein EXE43_09535 [Halorubrum sp. SS5]|nr:hypothetical protein EXE43_09535 [Halorubrum sp. SS5]